MTQLSIVKWVEKLLSGCEGTANHTDDIIVHGSDELQYDKRLENVLQILKDNEYLITLKIPDRRSFEYSSFETLKIRLSNLKTLGYYNPVGRTQIIADAFPVGLGAVLVQIDRHGPRIIGFGNKSITDCEKRYCQTEKEALALVWAVEHFKIYLLGKEVELISDHKPLETIYGNKALRGSKLIIPKQRRDRVLEAAHQGHPGFVAMKGRLRTKVCWPKIDRDAESRVKTCKGRTLVSSPKPHPTKRRDLPSEPCLDVAVYFLGPLPSNDYLLILIDYYSRYKEIKIIKNINCHRNHYKSQGIIFSIGISCNPNFR
ncbi:unnamed protein product [Pieris macdunnoughi]|uniref:RNA-directed DNA polymerase n=1 Tax=Pieris macdunnoughi TaxID=345717 RepID=A0A821YDY4_9NEOP|nr:unnamed protein product [Pieris macdunnoughi]